MAAIRSRGNAETELAAIRVFRAHLITGWRRGITLRIPASEAKPRLIRPDFVFHARRLAVFIDGEFWHGHPTRARIPKTRTVWWRNKIEGNKARDRRQNRLLRNHGWTVVRIWQFELKTAAALRKLAKVGLIKV